MNLTRREFLVWALIARGMSNYAIADQLVCRLTSVEKHIYNLYWKLGLPVDRAVNRRVVAARMWWNEA